MPQQRVTFPLGDVVATPGVISALNCTGEEVTAYLTRYQHGDWGDIEDDERHSNDEAIRTGGQLMGSYILRDRTEIWIITSVDRAITTICLPDEY
jgi:hypothetical protein